MLFSITGLPGHGKTLYSLEFVEKLKTNQKDEEGSALPDRPVFYFGINDLKLDWNYFDDPHKWFDLPDNSIIVIDEAQEHFPVRAAKDKVPDYCSRLERHRHSGWDIILLTQDVRFLDHHVRRLIGQHKHIERKFGSHQAVIYEWEKTGNPDDYHSKQKATTSPWRIKKKYFDAYKSATKHTVKRKIPKFLFLLIPIFGVIGYGIYAINSMFFDDESTFAQTEKTSGLNPISSVSSLLGNDGNSGKRKLSFLENLQPEIADIPQSAPFYRELYQAKSFPKPNCIATADSSRCNCYSQQGSKMNISLRYCLNIVENGYFDPTIEDTNNKEREQNQRGERRLASRDDVTDKVYYPTGVTNSREF